MQRLSLDFRHPLPRPHWAGWFLLAAGLALAGWTAWQDVQTQHALDAAVAAAPRMPAAAVRRPVAATGDVQSAARQAKAQLAVPWDALFVRLETHRPRTIALIALEADARKIEATVTAEARSAGDMLAWVEQLKTEAGFATVTLASHALQESDPQQPLRFVLRVRWRG
ncbi:MAG: hypothetical protein AB1720_12720 [Pseudomonadota bacterium]|jgi:hypothetical protein